MNPRSLPRILLTLLVIIAGVASGALLGFQLRNPNLPRAEGPTSLYATLLVTHEELTEEQDGLRRTVTELQEKIARTQDELKLQRGARDQVETLERLRSLAGLTPESGDGLVVTLANGTGEEGIIFGSDLRDVLNVLWEAGASAVAVNGERMVITSAIDTLATTTLINGHKLTSPYVMTALGSPVALQKAFDKAPLLGTLRDRSKQGTIVLERQQAKAVSVPAFTGTFELKHLTAEEEVS